MPQLKQIAIIGAGPAGLMAAEILAQTGHHITVYDRMPSPARKFLIAGRGGLNLTHSEPLDQFLKRYGTATEWLRPAITAFPPSALREWCESLGEPTFVGSSGRIFPKTMKAVTLLRAWLKRLENLGVQYRPRHRWLGWENGALHFINAQQQTVHVTADATLLALGGASWPRLGSDGHWADILQRESITVAPLRPANSGFTVAWSDLFRDRFAGEPLKSIALTHQGITLQGEAMLTATGIEGGVIYALSAALRQAVETRGTTTITIDLRPTMTLEALTTKIENSPRANKSFSTWFRKLGFSPLAINLLREVTPSETLNNMGAASLARQLKSLPLTITGVAPIDRAISSAGGIPQSAVTGDFMLQQKPGIFVAGEMLDWEAPTGGYLLQGCFSTAVAAAQGILHYLK